MNAAERVAKDIKGEGWIIESPLITIRSVYSHKLDAELVARNVGGKVVPVLVTDNSRLAKLRNAREVFTEFGGLKGTKRPVKMLLWLAAEISEEEEGA